MPYPGKETVASEVKFCVFRERRAGRATICGDASRRGIRRAGVPALVRLSGSRACLCRLVAGALGRELEREQLLGLERVELLPGGFHGVHPNADVDAHLPQVFLTFGGHALTAVHAGREIAPRCRQGEETPLASASTPSLARVVVSRR